MDDNRAHQRHTRPHMSSPQDPPPPSAASTSTSTSLPSIHHLHPFLALSPPRFPPPASPSAPPMYPQHARYAYHPPLDPAAAAPPQLQHDPHHPPPTPPQHPHFFPPHAVQQPPPPQQSPHQQQQQQQPQHLFPPPGIAYGLPSSSSDPHSHDLEQDQDSDPQDSKEPAKKKRRRQALSCTECKRRKIRCDRNQPCGPCMRRGEQDKCKWHVIEATPASNEKFVTRGEYDSLQREMNSLRRDHDHLASEVARLQSVVVSYGPHAGFAQPYPGFPSMPHGHGGYPPPPPHHQQGAQGHPPQQLPPPESSRSHTHTQSQSQSLQRRHSQASASTSTSSPASARRDLDPHAHHHPHQLPHPHSQSSSHRPGSSMGSSGARSPGLAADSGHGSRVGHAGAGAGAAGAGPSASAGSTELDKGGGEPGSESASEGSLSVPGKGLLQVLGKRASSGERLQATTAREASPATTREMEREEAKIKTDEEEEGDLRLLRSPVRHTLPPPIPIPGSSRTAAPGTKPFHLHYDHGHDTRSAPYSSVSPESSACAPYSHSHRSSSRSPTPLLQHSEQEYYSGAHSSSVRSTHRPVRSVAPYRHPRDTSLIESFHGFSFGSASEPRGGRVPSSRSVGSARESRAHDGDVDMRGRRFDRLVSY
ncbi:hypothetical protein BOTBODRAFT_28335 [Botryobasidium botryosum FD-172 SS1]|uniref:Zn(2)-C6 fungal-type domain-containing protein n=1 Tax=Botryobasidium botryosum (strain FD-172 SS1) TaxID=930990 RepID=A0A067MSZ8_BOTB1|nr:hypothetical protein BOTBODRAFT_28335 [Botryobasidium botryosum FD-172 SS1]